MTTEFIQPSIEEVERAAELRDQLTSAATSATEFFLQYTVRNPETGKLGVSPVTEFDSEVAKKYVPSLLLLEAHNFDSLSAFNVSQDELSSYGRFLQLFSELESVN